MLQKVVYHNHGESQCRFHSQLKNPPQSPFDVLRPRQPVGPQLGPPIVVGGGQSPALGSAPAPPRGGGLGSSIGGLLSGLGDALGASSGDLDIDEMLAQGLMKRSAERAGSLKHPITGLLNAALGGYGTYKLTKTKKAKKAEAKERRDQASAAVDEMIQTGSIADRSKYPLVEDWIGVLKRATAHQDMELKRKKAQEGDLTSVFEQGPQPGTYIEKRVRPDGSVADIEFHRGHAPKTTKAPDRYGEKYTDEDGNIWQKNLTTGKDTLLRKSEKPLGETKAEEKQRMEFETAVRTGDDMLKKLKEIRELAEGYDFTYQASTKTTIGRIAEKAGILKERDENTKKRQRLKALIAEMETVRKTDLLGSQVTATEEMGFTDSVLALRGFDSDSKSQFFSKLDVLEDKVQYEKDRALQHLGLGPPASFGADEGQQTQEEALPQGEVSVELPQSEEERAALLEQALAEKAQREAMRQQEAPPPQTPLFTNPEDERTIADIIAARQARMEQGRRESEPGVVPGPWIGDAGLGVQPRPPRAQLPGVVPFLIPTSPYKRAQGLQ